MQTFSAVGRLIVMTVGAALLSATLATAQEGAASEPEVPPSFFRSSPAQKDLAVERPSMSVPVFPKLGSRTPAVTVDYFYTHDCSPCADASRALLSILEGRDDLQVVFHPIAADQSSYDDALAETILYASAPPLFELYHFASMAAEISNIDLDRSVLLSDLIKTAEDPDTIVGRFEHFQSWTASIPLNSSLLGSFEAKSLPVFVINDALYEGFATPEALRLAIERAGSSAPD